MGRFNWIWRTLRTLSVIMCAVCLPSMGAALPLTGGDKVYIAGGGWPQQNGCSVNTFADEGSVSWANKTQVATIYVALVGGPYHIFNYAGGVILGKGSI
jgi:hypothetical protein